MDFFSFLARREVHRLARGANINKHLIKNPHQPLTSWKLDQHVLFYQVGNLNSIKFPVTHYLDLPLVWWWSRTLEGRPGWSTGRSRYPGEWRWSRRCSRRGASSSRTPPCPRSGGRRPLRAADCKRQCALCRKSWSTSLSSGSLAMGTSSPAPCPLSEEPSQSSSPDRQLQIKGISFQPQKTDYRHDSKYSKGR